MRLIIIVAIDIDANLISWDETWKSIKLCLVVCFNELQFHIQQCNVKGTEQTLSGWKKVIKLTFSIFQGSLFCGWFTFATFGIKFACNSIHMTNAPGCFIWNFVISNGSTTEMVQFWPPCCQSQNVFERRQIIFKCQTFVYIFKLFVYNSSNKLAPLKRILALPTKDQIRTVFFCYSY